jgi:hypothetical protein
MLLSKVKLLDAKVKSVENGGFNTDWMYKSVSVPSSRMI